MARTDNDTWDLASSVGATATMVAAQRVLAHREGASRLQTLSVACVNGAFGLVIVALKAFVH